MYFWSLFSESVCCDTCSDGLDLVVIITFYRNRHFAFYLCVGFTHAKTQCNDYDTCIHNYTNNAMLRQKHRNKRFVECITTIRYTSFTCAVFAYYVLYIPAGITLSTLPIRSNNQYCDSNGTSAVHVHDVVTDCTRALRHVQNQKEPTSYTEKSIQ